MKTIISICIMSAFIHFCSTGDTLTNSESNYKIDPNIIGDWVNIITRNSSGRPKHWITGINISFDGKLTWSAIELSNGKLMEYQPYYYPPTRIDSAANNKIIFTTTTVYYPNRSYHTGVTVEGRYTQRNDSITFHEDSLWTPLRGTFIKTKRGNQIETPVNVNFTVNIDKDTFETAPVWPEVSAYCSAYISSPVSNYRIQAVDINGRNFDIFVNGGGVGVYVLGKNKDGFAVYRDETGIGIQTKEEDNGTLEITSLDLEKGRCTGKMNFYIGEHKFENGSFDIPFYKIEF